MVEQAYAGCEAEKNTNAAINATPTMPATMMIGVRLRSMNDGW